MSLITSVIVFPLTLGLYIYNERVTTNFFGSECLQKNLSLFFNRYLNLEFESKS